MCPGVTEMAQQLGAFTTLTEDQHLVPSIHNLQPFLTPALGTHMLLVSSGSCMHVVPYVHTHKISKYIFLKIDITVFFVGEGK